MQCTKCRYTDSRVVDTKYEEYEIIKRRRECLKCGHRFNTVESAKEVKKEAS